MYKSDVRGLAIWPWKATSWADGVFHHRWSAGLSQLQLQRLEPYSPLSWGQNINGLNWTGYIEEIRMTVCEKRRRCRRGFEQEKNLPRVRKMLFLKLFQFYLWSVRFTRFWGWKKDMFQSIRRLGVHYSCSRFFKIVSGLLQSIFAGPCCFRPAFCGFLSLIIYAILGRRAMIFVSVLDGD